MAEDILNLGCDNDSEIEFDEEILKLLREEWDIPDQFAFDETIEAILNSEDDWVYELEPDYDEFMPSDDDEWILAEARRVEQQGANPLFSVIRERLVQPKR